MSIFVDSPPPKTLGEKVAKGLKEPKKVLQDMNKKKFIEWYIKNKRKPGDTDYGLQEYAEDAWDLEEDTILKPIIIKRETKKEFKERQNHPPNWNNYDSSLEKFMDDVTGGPKTKKPKNGGYKRTRRTKRNKRNTRKRFKRK
jgi:hypothetical protein